MTEALIISLKVIEDLKTQLSEAQEGLSYWAWHCGVACGRLSRAESLLKEVDELLEGICCYGASWRAWDAKYAAYKASNNKQEKSDDKKTTA